MSLLVVDDLTISINTSDGRAHILDHVSFEIAASESVGLVGESGSGKSMTSLAILGLLPEAAEVTGSIRFDGEELIGKSDAELSELRGNRIAMVFQEPMTALNPVHTVGDQVAEGLRLHLGLSSSEAFDRAAELLDRVGLPPERFPLSRYPHELSGGQRQRVGIAAALACGPKLLICDEPTTALDVTIQAQILDLLAEICHEDGMALLFITHDLGVIAEMTDRMLVMYAGSVAEAGTTAKVFDQMAHPYTHGLFSAMPSTEDVDTETGVVKRLQSIRGQVLSPFAPRVGCPFAERCDRMTDECTRDTPPLQVIEDGHTATCFHPLNGEAAA